MKTILGGCDGKDATTSAVWREEKYLDSRTHPLLLHGNSFFGGRVRRQVAIPRDPPFIVLGNHAAEGLRR